MSETSRAGRARIHALFRLFLILPLWLVLCAAAAPGDDRGPPLRDWQRSLEEMDKQLADPNVRGRQLAAMRDRLVVLRSRLQEAITAAGQEADLVRKDLDALGPPPKEGEPPEVADIVARRKDLNGRLAAADGAKKEGELLLAQVDRTADQIKALRRTRFTEQVFSRDISPLTPAIWTKAGAELKDAYEATVAAVAAQVETETRGEPGLTIGRHVALGLLAGVLLAFPLRAHLIRRYGYIAVEGRPTYRQRLWAAVFTGVVQALLPSMAAGAIYLGLYYDDLLSDPVDEVARTILLGLTAVFFVAGFCRSALAPHAVEWRLLPVHDEAARGASRALTALAALFALDWALKDILRVGDGSVELIAVHKFVLGLLISAVLLSLLRRKVWFRDEAAQLSPGWRRLRSLLSVLVWAIPLTAVVGYVALSRLLANQLVLTLGLWALVASLRVLLAEFIEHSLARDGRLGAYVRSTLGVSDDGAEIIRFWLNGVLQALLLALAVVALPWLWGATGKDFDAWFQSMFFGFSIGNIRISVAAILLALALFALFLLITRRVQRTLDEQIFPRTRMDMGLRHSIRSGVGYVGFTVALLVAVSALGLDLSNLAIIAGALSVGIGFGLQNIVNNFVSGLILLVERPIKAGDWVVVGEFQGFVKNISVRATEISTFDRASVFIPNSNLIANPVMNRTHADKTGRVVVPVGVAYDADPAEARDIMLEIAKAHPEVRKNPPPLVLFKGFGESALNLEVIAYLLDVEKGLSVNSDLCFAIHAAFREQGIGIPFPQREVRVSFDPDHSAEAGKLKGTPQRPETGSDG
jgi:small-conductance mechanosensitive channel